MRKAIRENPLTAVLATAGIFSAVGGLASAGALWSAQWRSQGSERKQEDRSVAFVANLVMTGDDDDPLSLVIRNESDYTLMGCAIQLRAAKKVRVVSQDVEPILIDDMRDRRLSGFSDDIIADRIVGIRLAKGVVFHPRSEKTYSLSSTPGMLDFLGEASGDLFRRGINRTNSNDATAVIEPAWQLLVEYGFADVPGRHVMGYNLSTGETDVLAQLGVAHKINEMMLDSQGSQNGEVSP